MEQLEHPDDVKKLIFVSFWSNIPENSQTLVANKKDIFPKTWFLATFEK